MEIFKVVIVCVSYVVVLMRLSAAQVLMAELAEYKIDPLNLNGTEPYTDLTIDQIITRAMGGMGVAANSMVGPDGIILAELDMRLTQDQFFNLYEQPQKLLEMPPSRGKRQAIRNMKRKARRQKRKAIRDVILRWPKGIIPYKFVTGHFDDKEKYMIRTAMTEWEKYTCLKFREATNSDRNLVRFQNGLGCNSQLGMVGGQQALNLDKNGCRFKGLYLHEIGHAIGLVHEHQLPTRDEYIEILDQNVQPDMRIWFNKYSSQEVNQMLVPYEYSSVMHYGITAFSHDGKSQTIRAKQPDKEKTIGRVYKKELSFTDVKIVNLMYNCAGHCESSIVCNNGGYVDQNCKCICPDGSDACTKSKSTTPDLTCFNAHEDWQCNVWANQGECNKNPRFMLEGCKKACRLCGNEDKDDDSCKDNYEAAKCQIWKANGECIVNKDWMHKHCRATCKACRDSGPDPDVECNNVHKNISECDKWAAEGECQINPGWMPANCKKSCHMCNEAEKPVTTPEPTPEPGQCSDIHNTIECQGWAETGECDLNPNWMIPNCRKSCRKCNGDGGKQECKNTWDDKQCEGWARDQECLKNSNWMHTNCHKACTKCSTDGATTDGGKTYTTQRIITTQGSTTCTNNHRNEQECVNWAKYGHCKINQWMTTHCKKACGECDSQDEVTTPTPKPDRKDSGSVQCEDKEKYCGGWAEHGFCEDNPGVALRICKKSCKACDDAVKECFDQHQLCPVWSSGGQCQRNTGYMLRYCQKSCGVCK